MPQQVWDVGSDGQEAEEQALGYLERQRRRRGPGRSSHEIWQHSNQFEYPASINNSVMLYIPPTPHFSDFGDSWPSPSSSRANEMLPRLVVSNNDRSVKFLDVSLTKGGFGRHVRESWFGRGNTMEERQFEIVGILQLPVPVNHSAFFSLLSDGPDDLMLYVCSDGLTRWFYAAVMRRFILYIPTQNYLQIAIQLLPFTYMRTRVRTAHHTLPPALAVLPHTADQPLSAIRVRRRGVDARRCARVVVFRDGVEQGREQVRRREPGGDGPRLGRAERRAAAGRALGDGKGGG